LEYTDAHKRDFEANHFPQFRALVAQHTGINLADSKVDMVYRRFVPRLKKLGLKDFGADYELLQGNDREELTEFANIITTNLTSFFREKHHFDFLASEVLPAIQRAHASGRRLRIWSAGCSTGAEPYSIAMVLREVIPDIDQWDARILATDLDTNCLAKAEAGLYSEKEVEGVSGERLSRWFDSQRVNEKLTTLRAKPELGRLIRFRHLNLMHEWPFAGRFDVIFCRNVMIYFTKDTQAQLVAKFARHQQPGDHLIIGHSENIAAIAPDYQLLAQTTYRKR
jgi:chemotaxis protein methyltransferase CheR